MTVDFKPQSINVSIGSAAVGISTGSPIVRKLVEREPYDGSYEVTPSAEMQTLATKNFRMTDNITINPIPSNYGLITWSGAGIRVS